LRNKRLLKLSILVFFLMGLSTGIILFIRYKKTHITTDDAYVRGHIHWIHPRIAGTIIGVLVKDNQFVRKGKILVLLDPERYGVKLSEAMAELKLAQAKLREEEVNVKATESEVSLSRAEFIKAKADFHRAEALYPEKVIPKQKYEQYLTNYQVTEAKLNVIKKKLRQAKKRVKTSLAQIKFAQAKVEESRLNLRYTRISAPLSGYVTKKSAETGQRVNPAQPVLAVVPLDDIWIEANYKENQLEKIKPGQKVILKVDAFPRERFCGEVESIQSGSGAVFSLFPPEDATGNWIKITQRVPVKIILKEPVEVVLRIGMSAVATVLVE